MTPMSVNRFWEADMNFMSTTRAMARLSILPGLLSVTFGVSLGVLSEIAQQLSGSQSAKGE